jgi:hypothetical protein
MKKLIVLFALMMPLSVIAAETLVEDLQGTSGSAVGPGGALYVTDGLNGQVWRVDPDTGSVSLFASNLPLSPLQMFIGFGGAVDVAFIGGTAYVLVTAVGERFGPNIDGIYRVDGWDANTLVADIGTFSAANVPDAFPVDLPNGLQYALETYRGGFLVTDGHHNRVLRVTLDGEVSEFLAFDEDAVPTGLEVIGKTVYLAEAGPVPHDPDDGKVVSFGPKSPIVTEASGAPLLVDVERGRGRTLFALSQGEFPCDEPGCLPAAAAALPETGALLEVNGDGTFTVIEGGLNLPTSVEIIKNTAYVVTLSGEILKIDGIAGPPFGASRRK